MKKGSSHLSQRDPEVQMSHQSDHKEDHENKKRPGGITRRGFIVRTISMVAATDFALSQKLFSANVDGYNSGDLTHIAAKNAKNEIILLITPVFINKSKPAKLLSVNYQSNTNLLFC